MEGSVSSPFGLLMAPSSENGKKHVDVSTGELADLPVWKLGEYTFSHRSCETNKPHHITISREVMHTKTADTLNN